MSYKQGWRCLRHMFETSGDITLKSQLNRSGNGAKTAPKIAAVDFYKACGFRQEFERAQLLEHLYQGITNLFFV